MIDTIQFIISKLREDREEFRGDVHFFYNKNEYIFLNVNLKDLHTKINTWLDSEFLETFAYKNHFNIETEDGERWYLHSETSNPKFKVDVDIDELILELWKLNARIEVDLQENFNIDISPKKKTR